MTPLRRLVGLVLTLVFAVNSAMLTRGHGCAAESAVAVAGHGTHGGHAPAGGSTRPALPAECDCIGHACCSAPPSPAAPRPPLSRLVPAPTAGVPRYSEAVATPVAPPHLRPFSHAPPTPLG